MEFGLPADLIGRLAVAIGIFTIVLGICGQLADWRHEKKHREFRERLKRTRAETEKLMERFRHPTMGDQ